MEERNIVLHVELSRGISLKKLLPIFSINPSNASINTLSLRNLFFTFISSSFPIVDVVFQSSDYLRKKSETALKSPEAKKNQALAIGAAAAARSNPFKTSVLPRFFSLMILQSNNYFAALSLSSFLYFIALRRRILPGPKKSLSDRE